MKETLLRMWNEKEQRRRFLLVALGALTGLIFFYSFIYNDILETMRVGISLWDYVFSGQIRAFYGGRWIMNPTAYTKEVQAVYDFPIYIIFAIWNFPLWLLEHFAKVDIFTSFWCLAWGKTLLLVSVILVNKALYRLCRTLDMTKDRAELVCLLFLTSNFFISSVVVMCAYDIIALFFAIVGLDYYFKGDMKKFVMCFMCSIPLKFFSLLIYLPLILLKEKRVLKIVEYMFLSILPILVFRFLIPCAVEAGISNNVSWSIVNSIKSTNLSNLAWIYVFSYETGMALGRVALPIVGWMILYLGCYIVHIEDEGKCKQWGIYICFITYAILFVCCFSHPYWILVMMPFIVIIIGQNIEIAFANTITEMILTWGMLLAQVFKFPWCFGSALVYGMFWPKILGEMPSFLPVTVMTIYTTLTGSEGSQGYLIDIGNSVFMAGIIVFAIINNPLFVKSKMIQQYGESIPRWVWILRILSDIGVAVLPIALYGIGLWHYL